jgi:hypothetical protein
MLQVNTIEAESRWKCIWPVLVGLVLTLCFAVCNGWVASHVQQVLDMHGKPMPVATQIVLAHPWIHYLPVVFFGGLLMSCCFRRWPARTPGRLTHFLLVGFAIQTVVGCLTSIVLSIPFWWIE